MQVVENVTLSSDFQVTIPRQLVEKMGLKSGGTMQIVSRGNSIELIPANSMKEFRGVFKGADLSIERDDEDRL